MEESSTVDLGIDGIGPATPLAAGGFAQVYTAEQTSFRRMVAVKVLFAAQHNEVAFGRFERECHAIGAVSDHPNIVVVHDRGTTQAGHPYITMEFRNAGSLSDRLKSQGTMTSHEIIELGIKIGEALRVAHNAGVLHRDVKPANILLSSYGEPALADFGIARIEGGDKTTSGKFSASVAHAPREVLDGKEPTERSDIYSLGSTMFEMFVGHPPYTVEDSDSVWPLISKIMTEPVPDPAMFGMPDALAQIVQKALSHDAEARYGSAGEMIEALNGLVLDHSNDGQQTVQRGPAVGGSATAPSSARINDAADGDSAVTVAQPLQGSSSFVQSDHSPKKRRVSPMSAVFALLALGGVCVVAALIIFRPISLPSELKLEAASEGPLEAGESYSMTLTNADEESVLQLLVDGVPVGDAAPGLPNYPAEPGRHKLSIEIDGDEVTNTVDVYVSSGSAEGQYRANLASVSQQRQNWVDALTEYDKLVEAGHSSVEVHASSDGEWWRFFVDGFEERDEAQNYCDSFDLPVKKCFVGEL